jgi:hypothetical protein
MMFLATCGPRGPPPSTTLDPTCIPEWYLHVTSTSMASARSIGGVRGRSISHELLGFAPAPRIPSPHSRGASSAAPASTNTTGHRQKSQTVKHACVAGSPTERGHDKCRHRRRRRDPCTAPSRQLPRRVQLSSTAATRARQTQPAGKRTSSRRACNSASFSARW